MNTVFLLGSGVSIDAKMPCVSAITAQIVSGVGVWRHTKGKFVLDPTHPGYDLYRPPMEPVLAFVNDLRRRAAEYFNREPNYEELSQFAQQIKDALSGEYENPAVMPLLAELGAQPSVEGDQYAVGDLGARADAAHSYIADTVHQMLGKAPARLDHLGVIVEACNRLGRVDIATLNHDLVLEATLDDAGIGYADGFDQSTADVRRWADAWGDTPVRLLKLHGSIDSWDYNFVDEPWRGWVTARYEGNDPDLPTRGGVVDGPRVPRPVFLVSRYVRQDSEL